MRSFEIVQSDTDTTTSHSGLALVGRALGLTRLAVDLDAIPLRHGIAHADCVKSDIGLLCTGKSDFDAIENRRNDAFFATALGIARSPPTLAGALMTNDLDRLTQQSIPPARTSRRVAQVRRERWSERVCESLHSQRASRILLQQRPQGRPNLPWPLSTPDGRRSFG